MPIAVGRWFRFGAAAAFAVGATAAIAVTAARSLDVQGNDALARQISKRPTDQQWTELSLKMSAPKGVKPLDAATLAQLRDEAVRDPLSSVPLFLTGATRKLNGDRAGGTRLVALAVRRDPRFRPARYWQINDAIDRGRAGEATDAVLRVIVLDPDSLMRTVAMLVLLTRSPESWPKIRAALPKGAAWREIYYNQLVEAKVEPSIVFNAIDAVRVSSGAPPGIREQSALLASMVQKGDFDRAYTAWLGWLPPDELGKVAYLYDGSFTGAPGATPFNWTLSSGGDGAAAIEKERGLRFDYSPNTNMKLAAETILMPPGKYRLTSYSMLDQELSNDVPMPVVWQVMCLPKRNVIATLRLPNSSGRKGVGGEFVVPADCLAQTLSLEGQAMEYPVRAGGYVRSIAIEKAK